LESVNFGVVVFDNHEQITYINKMARQLLNIKSDPETLDDILDKRTYQQFKMILSQKDLPIKREEINVWADNRPDHYLGYSVYPLKSSPDGEEKILIFSEISQTKRIQAEIIRMDRMASLGILSSGIAHEIRNPLAGIKAMAQTLEEELENETHLVEYVARILRQVNRLEGLLKTFFTYAKPQRPNPKPCQIENIIREVLPLFERKLKEEKIKVVQNYTPDLHEIFVDSSQIEQVLFNLIINSIQAMKEDGILKIIARNADNRLPTIDRRLRSPGLLSDNFIEIAISDNGAGIPPDIKENIFNPFFTTKANGTGLGLSIVYQIVREHGGQVDVDSNAGKGTKFSILLPAVIEK
jgi:nitrogen-specific signal transduction histidine kinase